jgi:hypothetical protein
MRLGALIGTPLAVGEFLEIAQQLARKVSHLHHAGLLHGALNPAHVAWSASMRQVQLSDSAAAPETLDPAYMSPEQTGRTGRSPDARADLYSLGAIFHALLTGAPPFPGDDPLELVHAHLARQPHAVAALNPQVPAILSDLLLKLLEKEPEQRYQSADALVADLQEISTQWRRNSQVQPFALGARETTRAPLITDHLYGRRRESDVLLDAFQRVRAGGRELVLVTGDPGIGKTALVAQLDKPVAACRGYFVSGKFDQLQRSVPYAGLVHAFRSLVHQLLTEPDTTLAAWRQRIQAAVAPNCPAASRRFTCIRLTSTMWRRCWPMRWTRTPSAAPRWPPC